MIALPSLTGLFILFVVLLFLSAFFAGSETALISVNKVRLSHLVKQGGKRAKVAQELVLRLDRLITTILVWNSLVNTAMAAIGTSICIKVLGPELGVLVATFLVTVLILIFGEISPKIFSASNSDKTALRIAYPMKTVVLISTPIVFVFTRIGRFVVKLFGGKTGKRGPLVTEEEMRFMVEAGKEEGIYGDLERFMLHRIFEFGDLKIEDVMIPLREVDMVSLRATEQDLFDVCAEEGHQRVPVYEEERENIVGIVYSKDLLHLLLNDQLIKIPDILHEPLFVHPMMKVTTLLKEFLKRKLHIAIVGHKTQAVGLVTLEDLLEEIVGEIEEEQPKLPDERLKKKRHKWF
jgi:CBS domain containing-hemolysin-like protein